MLNLRFKSCDNAFKLLLCGTTIVDSFDSLDIPINKYNFVHFSDILDGNFCPNLLVGKIILDLYQDIIYKLTKSHVWFTNVCWLNVYVDVISGVNEIDNSQAEEGYTKPRISLTITNCRYVEAIILKVKNDAIL